MAWYKESKRHSLAARGIRTKVKEKMTPKSYVGKQPQMSNLRQQQPQQRRQNQANRDKIFEKRRKAHSKLEEKRQDRIAKRQKLKKNQPHDFWGRKFINEQMVGKTLGKKTVKDGKEKRKEPRYIVSEHEIGVPEFEEERYQIRWKEKTGIKHYDKSIGSTDPNREYDAYMEHMDLNEFKRRQYEIAKLRRGTDSPRHDLVNESSSSRRAEIDEQIKDGELQTPFILVYDEKGHYIPQQSDVNLMFVAEKMDVPTVKVWTFKKRSEDDKIRDTYKEKSSDYTRVMKEVKKMMKEEK